MKYSMNLSREISKTTDIDEAVLIEKILAVLNEDRYGIKRLTHNCVEFSDYNGGMRWRSEYFGLLNSGEFNIERSGDKNVLKLSYLTIPLSEVVFIAAVFLFFATFAIVNEIYGGFFIGFAFVSTMLCKYFNIRRIAAEMLDEITQR